jgi:hypothetical protein
MRLASIYQSESLAERLPLSILRLPGAIDQDVYVIYGPALHVKVQWRSATDAIIYSACPVKAVERLRAWMPYVPLLLTTTAASQAVSPTRGWRGWADLSWQHGCIALRLVCGRGPHHWTLRAALGYWVFWRLDGDRSQAAPRQSAHVCAPAPPRRGWGLAAASGLGATDGAGHA